VHAEGSIAGILKQPGEGVETDEVLFQIETDKVTIDVRAPQSGTLEEILV
jgi:2-oxoglutarate dehydrogenase E2 component (dihydrolipoamide succinyltransferase)